MVAQIDSKYFRARPSRVWSRLIAYAFFEGRPLTTKGQWLNPFLSIFFRFLCKLPILRAPTAPLFIVGTGRSGTTVLGLILSMHRDVGFLNEPKAIWAALRGDEDLIGTYHRGAARYRLDSSDAAPHLSDAAHKIYGAYLRLSMSWRVVDKYPELIFRMPYIRKIFPDAKFLFISRDGWDTCASIEGWSARYGLKKNGELHDWWGVNRRKWNLLVDQIIVEHSDLAAHSEKLRTLQDHRAMAATEWIVTMREGMRSLDEHPDVVFHVPYDELCAKPLQVCHRIAEFAGLSEDHVFLEYAQTKLATSTGKKKFDLPDFLEGPFNQTNEALRLRTAGCSRALMRASGLRKSVSI